MRLLNEKNMQPSGLPPQYVVGEQNNVAATIKVILNSAVNPYQGNLSGVAEQLSVAFGGLPGNGGQASENIPVEIRTILTKLVSRTNLMSSDEAKNYASTINSVLLTPSQIQAIVAFIKKRDQVLIDYYKNKVLFKWIY